MRRMSAMKSLPLLTHSLMLAVSAWVVMLALEFMATGRLEFRGAYVWVAVGIALASGWQSTHRGQATTQDPLTSVQSESRSR